MEKANHPVQGTGADGLKRAMGPRTSGCRNTSTLLVIACHDELVVECLEEQAEEVTRFLEEVMVARG